jgi:S1-C subfamily serine protease
MRSRLRRLLWPLALSLTWARPTASRAGDEAGAERAFHAAREYTLRVRTVIDTPLFAETRGAWFGAGFLVDAARGWIVTNAHVAARSPSQIEVSFADEEYQPAHKVYVDPFADIAVLALDHPVPGRRVARLDRTAPAVIGEPVGAYGHPNGLPFTGTRGIVSALTDQYGADLLQIDATVDHGNSGGPVIALRDGCLLGIATAMTEGERSDRMNFATPISEVRDILNKLRKGEDPSPPVVGVGLLQDEENRHTMRVAATFDSLRWPLRPGDRLVRIQGERDTLSRLTELVEGLRGRTQASLLVERDHRRLAVEVHPTLHTHVLDQRGISIDGALFSPVSFDDDLGKKEPPAILIHSVDPASDAQSLGLQVLDQLWSVDGRRFGDLDSLIAYVEARPKTPLQVVVRRVSGDWDMLREYHARELPNRNVRRVPDKPAASVAGN